MPDPFISSQDLSDILGRDVTADNGALIAIDTACDICRDTANQSFAAGTATVNLDGSGTDALILPGYPVQNAGTVLVNGQPETAFMLTNNGVLLRGSAGSGWGQWGGQARPIWPRGRQNVTVTFAYGYQPNDIPRSVRGVALQIAQRIVVQGVAINEQVGDVRVTYAAPALELTNNELRILHNYRRKRSF